VGRAAAAAVHCDAEYNDAERSGDGGDGGPVAGDRQRARVPPPLAPQRAETLQSLFVVLVVADTLAEAPDAR